MRHEKDIYGGTGTYDTLKVILHSQVMRELVLASIDNVDDISTSLGADDDAFKNGVLYVPFAKDFVPVVDIHRGRCEITPPNGLLEVAVSTFKSKNFKKSASQKARKKRHRGKKKEKSAINKKEEAEE